MFAVQKILYSHQIYEQIKDIMGHNANKMRIAYVGKAPQVSTYEPGLDVIKDLDIQAIVTTELVEAHEWLDIQNPL
ncbi:MAG: hypothetical protein QGG54_03845 [Gammaproteobacteria bacterium]|jgi:hypothetical protein|nr:hypothetical protein [Gammaproteobacteria bacterium]MDP6651575.1 hypothetical protein [Gammaproteobacteria bacterium]|tara:strand:+ start:83 stop:310 length:228 start_codon:yes stop_codon:yes gene_type:complete